MRGSTHSPPVAEKHYQVMGVEDSKKLVFEEYKIETIIVGTAIVTDINDYIQSKCSVDSPISLALMEMRPSSMKILFPGTMTFVMFL